MEAAHFLGMSLKSRFLFSLILILFMVGCARSGLQAKLQSENGSGVKTPQAYFEDDFANSGWEADFNSNEDEEFSGNRPNLNREEDSGQNDDRIDDKSDDSNDPPKSDPNGHLNDQTGPRERNDQKPKNKKDLGPDKTNPPTGNDQRNGGDGAKDELVPKIGGKKSSPSEGFDPSLLVPGAKPEDFIEKGKIVPTVYYQPLIIDDEKTCAGGQVAIRNSSGVELIRVCRSTYSNCLMQGSCVISRSGVNRSFNVSSGSRGTFSELKAGQCEFGFGVRSICLDPFYSVAADLNFYKPGDVIFVPAIVGGELPNGKMHSGFLVVRDRGGAIRGQHRFDFFSGTLHYQHPKNPFGRARLSDRRTRLIYFQVKGDTAKKILQSRSFPKTPAEAD